MTATVIEKTLRGLLAVAVLLLLAIGSMIYIAIGLNDATRWTIHTHQVIERLKDSLSTLQEVETADRGYVITGKKQFIVLLNEAEQRFQQTLKRVETLTNDNPRQVANLRELQSTAAEKIAFAHATLVDPKVGAQMISSLHGNDLMKRYRTQLQTMMDEEDHLLEERKVRLAQSQQLIWWGTGVFSLFSVGLLAWVFNITKLGIQQERDRTEEIRKINVGLESEIEQRKKVERALKDATMRLTSSNQDLQQFAYVASHDLQEPLRAVAGFLALLSKKLKAKGELDPESESWINFAVDGSQRMRNLINDLLSYARVESRGKPLVETDCNQALALAKTDLSVLLEETQAKIESDTLPTILADQSQITQLFQNLIGNAVKFRGSESPVVTITCEKQERDWLFSVKDNGIGFEQEHAQRIFVIFQRLQGREEYPGTGIGLALCKKIIDRHGGKIWAEAEKGKGACFRFTIPMMEGDKNGQSSN